MPFVVHVVLFLMRFFKLHLLVCRPVAFLSVKLFYLLIETIILFLKIFLYDVKIKEEGSNINNDDFLIIMTTRFLFAISPRHISFAFSFYFFEHCLFLQGRHLYLFKA
jgi:hypothetical protein